MSPKLRMVVAGLVALTLGSLSACGDDDKEKSSESPSASSPPTSTSSPSPSPSPTSTPTFRPTYGPIAEYLDEYLPKKFPVRDRYVQEVTTFDQDDFFAATCIFVDNTQLRGASRRNQVNRIANDFPGKYNDDEVLAEVLLDAIIEGCWETGLAERPWMFDPQDYGKFRDVLDALNDAGFGHSYIERAQTPEPPVADSCRAISGEKPGNFFYRSDRRSWMKVLTKQGANEWGWTERQATRFVDVVFEACLKTGHSKPYVPPVPSIGNGIWTIGRDKPPGTYRSNGVSSNCYWAIYRSGSNGQDIIANDLPSGGFPTVTLSLGQDFDTDGCGVWKKIG
ncbi:hypothetical protein [Nocardioides stalactiti]|uniref:hypothetical protein n=1 Tax=Nocardioides stalactiti TaxID=2755356 RepID=UPI0016029DF6|nr:hypothetical protein [Nocardioides stalactiti]